MVLIQELTGCLLLFNIFIYNTKPVFCNPVVWNYNCTMMTQTTCVQPQYMNLTYSEAQSFCNFNLSQGNVRADILHISPSTQDSIVKQGTDMTRMWTGASVIDHQWRWILNSKTIPTQLQGCFSSKQNLSDLIAIGDITTSSPSMTVTKCMKYCQDKRGFEYSTVSLESQGGNTQTITCRCSRQFWPQLFNSTVSEVAAVSCHTSCPSDTAQFCGGHNNTYLVYNINGKVYTNFVPNATTDNTHCTVLSTGETAWLKRSCKESNMTGYICDLPDKTTRSCEQSHPNNVLIKGKKCISFRTSNLNWFQASQECARMNGHLLLLDRTDIESDILSRMGSHYPNKDTEWWIGLTSRALVWSDGSPVTNYSPSMWGKGAPNMNTYKNCAVMDAVLNYTWYLTDCNELNQFYCNIKQQDGCSEKTCKHGGTCTGVYNRHTCVCTPRWTGTNCEVSINQAVTAPSTAATATPVNTSDRMTPIVVGVAFAVLAVITVIILILLLLYRQKSKKISRELSAIKKNKRGHSMLHRIASIFTIYEKIEEDRNSSFRRLNENGEVRLETIQEPPELPFRESRLDQVPETGNTHNQETGENCIVETERTATTDCEGYQSLHNTEISVPVSYQSLEGVGYETLQTELKSTPTDVYTKLNSTAPKNVKQENTEDKFTEQSQREHSRPTEEMSVEKCDSLAESVEEKEESSCDGHLKAQDSKTTNSDEESISTQTHSPDVGRTEEYTGNNNTDVVENHYLEVLDSSQDNPET